MSDMRTETLTGTVASETDGYFQVYSPDAPQYLEVMNLRTRQMNGAKVGDTVTMRYVETPNSGFWYVTAVTGRAE